jgi:hypothetical protein
LTQEIFLTRNENISQNDAVPDTQQQIPETPYYDVGEALRDAGGEE